MGLIRYHGKAVRLNGLTDGLVVPTGKFKEAGRDLRHPEFSSTAKAPKSDASKIGRRHEEQISNPLNSIRGAFTIDAFIIPDYGGVILEKPGQFKLAYGNPFSSGKLVFDVTTDDRPYRLESTFNVPLVTNNHSGSYSGGEHKAQDLTLGEQPLVMITAQFSRKFIRCFINGDKVAELNLGDERPLVSESSSDLFIGGQGGEFRGLIESIRLSRGINDPKIESLTKLDTTLGLWRFDDEIDVPDIYFFNNARPAVTYQGRDGPDTHDGLMPLPMVAVGHTFTTSSETNKFKIRDYPANPNASVDRYTALEKLASYITGIDLKDIKNQTWYASGSLDLTDAEYFSGEASTSLNAVINHSGTHLLTGMTTSPSSRMVRWSDDNVQATAAAIDLNPMTVRPERVRITHLDFVNSTLTCTSIHLANDAANGGVDNLPKTQPSIFYQTRSDDVLVWFVLGKSDILIDPGNPDVDAGVNNQKTRAKDTFTKYLFTQNQKFKDSTEFENDAYFISPKSRSVSSSSATVLADPSEEYAAMGGMTSYSIYEGDFFLKRLPQPDGQTVRQTIQGIANSFEYVTDDPSLTTIIGQNDIVKVTETVYTGPIDRIVNTSSSVLATDAGGEPFNRIVTESGVGFYATNNMSASTRDEIVAIAVDNIKPFLLKGLDDDYTAQLSGGVPTDDGYIRHLTPEKKARIATIDSPAALVSAGGPKTILVYYDAIDLTGEVVAGTGFNLRSGINTKFVPYHAIGNKGHLVVRKTVPCGSALFNSRPLSDWLRKPYSSAPANHKDILMKITAPGGILSLPTASFNGPMASNILSAAPTGDITPSPFINIEDCVVTVGTGIQGYGRPKPVPSTNTPDDSSNSEFHSLFVENIQLSNQTSYTSNKQIPASFRRSNLIGFDVIDNDLKADDSIVLVQPSKRERYGALSDILTTAEGGSKSSTATIELNLMKGRIEEVAPSMDTSGNTKLTLRGRSILMDISDSRAERDFNLSRGAPIKEIGDLGTPTVSMTLGGLGQGGIDIQPTYTEHPLFPGWKDRIVGTGNASVRNDKQTSTYYASTRALAEIPLFPSMFFDVDAIEDSNNDKRTPLSATRSFKMTVDATMTAMNRPQMKDYESRFAIDWGMSEFVSSVEVTGSFISQLLGAESFTNGTVIRCQRPSVQAVMSAYSNGVITVDDYSAFLKATGDRGDAAYLNELIADDESSNGAGDGGFWVTVGEGVSTVNDGYGVLVQVAKHPSDANKLIVRQHASGTTYRGYHPVTLTHADVNTQFFTGATVVMGGYINLGDAEDPSNNAVSESFAISVGTILNTYNSTHGTPSNFGYEDLKIAAIASEEIATAARKLLGLKSTAVQADALNVRRYFIRDGPNMNAFDYDITETHEAANDRHTVTPVVVKTNALALKGKKSDGASLDYVRPLELDFNDIAVKMGDFNLCVEEVIRRINMAGHPQAKNSAGGSAFNPPPLFTTTNDDTGTHMGYVRAFMGTDVESRGGEGGVSIVIHSTVPGAAGRNMCVFMNNNTPYPYKPNKIVGYAGITATNSRMYEPNSFPAPMPIGADGESFVPISTFRGAPHGSTVDAEGNVRSYDGLGGSFIAKTKGNPTVIDITTNANEANKTSNGSHHQMISPETLASAKSAEKLTWITVKKTAEDYLKRISADLSTTVQGIIRVNGKLADFEYITQQQTLTNHLCTDGFYIYNVRPREDIDSFFNHFFDTSAGQPSASNDLEIDDIDVEILWPPMDPQGVIFFGGGHTGVVLDISDGTANDYTNDYKHQLSSGPTGFTGFQNLHEVSGASAVLDFTNLKDTDTINGNSLRGFHHMMDKDANGELIDRCRLYMRMNDTVASGSHSQNNAQMVEDLYGSPARVTGTGADFVLVNGPANSVDSADKGMRFNHTGTDKDQCVALYNYNSGVEAEYGPMKEFDCTKPFSISAWFRGSTASAGGPIISGLDKNGRPWGLFIAGAQASSNQVVQTAFLGAEADGTKLLCLNDVSTGELRVDRDQWSCIVATKDADDEMTIYLGNVTGVTFGGSDAGGYWDIGSTTITGMVDITTPRTIHSGGSLSNVVNIEKKISTSDGNANCVAATIPTAVGSTAATNMTLIGTSAVKNISLGTGGNGKRIGKMYQGLWDYPWQSTFRDMEVIGRRGDTGVNIDGSDGVNESKMNLSVPHMFNGYLSNIAVYNKELTSAEVTELWTAKGVY